MLPYLLFRRLLVVSKLILAKPSGITLEEHQENVRAEGELLIKQIPATIRKYDLLIGKNLSRRLEIVTLFHDKGKQISAWQTACQKDYEAFLAWQSIHGGDFKEYTKVVLMDVGKNIRKASVRHEFYSLEYAEKKNAPLVLLVAIAAHHNKLGHAFEDRWKREKMESFWKKFKEENFRIIDSKPQNPLKETAKIHYEYAGPRGLLQLADHRASAKEEGDFVPDPTSFSYTFPHIKKRGVQKLIEEHWQENLLLVRAPTGAGKTDASLLWASMQIGHQRADRLIIAMPTCFTSNALAINVTESLSDTGLYHSSAWSSKFQERIDSGQINKQEANKLHEFARLLQTQVTVCTIDHLLMALTLTREDHHLITFTLANSCLVIDEADFYDDFTQANILVLLELCCYWNVPVLLMSASLPQSVLPLYQKLGYKIDKIVEDTSDNIRPRFEVQSIRNYNNLEEIEDLLNLCIEKGTAIIYVNTVDKAMMLSSWFDAQKVKSIIYHSRFTEPHKKEKEEELIKALGREAWDNGQAKGIAILTQIGEMSINISADLMISELCPIDRLTQRAGRLCRFDNSKIGHLHVLVPFKDENIYPAPYGEYDRGQKSWIPCQAFNKTLEILSEKQYSAKQLVDFLNEVYPIQSNFSSKATNNAESLKEYFMANWLINPVQKRNEDDTDTNYWKSRNIEKQDTVFVEKPRIAYFRNHFDLYMYKLQNSLELPVYMIKNALKQHKIDIMNIYIKGEEEAIYIVREGFYNKSKGISFQEE